MAIKLQIQTRQCIVCGFDIARNTKSGEKRIPTTQYKKAKFCSLKCKGDWQSKNIVGENNPNYKGGNTKCIDCGVTTKTRTNAKRETKYCKSCWYKNSKGENHPNWKGGVAFSSCVNCDAKTGDINSMLCRNCYRGALHPFWKGGVSSLQSLIRATKENRQFIKQCMYRDRYMCQNCGVESNGKNLQVHHIKQFAQILKDNDVKTVEDALKCDELWNNDNGITLCIPCHKLTDSFNKKIN